MADNLSDPNTLLILGEIRGQLRELIHTGNNNSAKIDALSIRIGDLEADKSRRDGAHGVLNTLARSPTLGWIAGAVATFWAYVTGRLQL